MPYQHEDISQMKPAAPGSRSRHCVLLWWQYQIDGMRTRTQIYPPRPTDVRQHYLGLQLSRLELCDRNNGSLFPSSSEASVTQNEPDTRCCFCITYCLNWRYAKCKRSLAWSGTPGTKPPLVLMFRKRCKCWYLKVSCYRLLDWSVYSL